MAIRITPLDIQKKTFARKKLGGVDETEVTAFLNEVASDYEKVLAELRTHRDQITALKQRLNEYAEMERTLKATLVSAQKTSGDMRQNAEKEAELILRNAELTAERIVEDGRREIRDLSEEIRNLKRIKRKLRIELKNLLDGYMDLLKEEAGPPPEGRLDPIGDLSADAGGVREGAG